MIPGYVLKVSYFCLLVAPSTGGYYYCTYIVSEEISRRRPTRGAPAARIIAAETSRVRVPLRRSFAFHTVLRSHALHADVFHRDLPRRARYSSITFKPQTQRKSTSPRITVVPCRARQQKQQNTVPTATAVRVQDARSFNLVRTPYPPPAGRCHKKKTRAQIVKPAHKMQTNTPPKHVFKFSS